MSINTSTASQQLFEHYTFEPGLNVSNADKEHLSAAISRVESYLRDCQTLDSGRLRELASQIVQQALRMLDPALPYAPRQLFQASLRLASQYSAQSMLACTAPVLPTETPARMASADTVRIAAPLRLSRWLEVCRSAVKTLPLST